VAEAVRSVAAARRGDGKMLLTAQDHDRIREATRAAEATTRGEIVCVVTEEASHYLEVPFAWASVGALVLSLAPLTMSSAAVWMDGGLRGWSAAHIAASHATVMAALGAYAILQCVVFLAIVLVVSIPPIRRALTPGFFRRGRVHQRAIEQFHASHLQRTRERTGVLIYASLKDRMAEIVADTGIDAKVGPQAWEEVIGVLITHLKANRPGDGFVAAIEASGRLLATHFPAEGYNPDELPNAVVERSGRS